MYTSREELEQLKTKEDALTMLRDSIRIRDKMDSNLYWNILNDECSEIANKCLKLGCSKEEISKITKNF